MEVKFSRFIAMSENKPNDMEFCMIVSADGAAMFGIYNKEKDAFWDGMGGFLDAKYVEKWTDMTNYTVTK